MPANTNYLKLGERLTVGQSLVSSNNQFRLQLQGDGDVAIYDVSLQPAVQKWHAGTTHHNPGYLLFQENGDLVMFDSADHGQWTTGTWEKTNRGLHLVLQNDGNLVIHGIAPVYTSHRHPHPNAPRTPAPPSPDGNGVNVTSIVVTLQGLETVVETAFSLLAF